MLRESRWIHVAFACAALATVGCGGGPRTLFIRAVPSSPSGGPGGEAQVTELGDADLRANGFGKVGYAFVTTKSATPAKRLLATVRTLAGANGGELLRVAYVRSRSWDTSSVQYTCQTTGVGTGMVSINCGNVLFSSTAGRATMLVSVWRRDAALAGQGITPVAARFKPGIDRLDADCRQGSGAACRALGDSGVADLVMRATLLSHGCELGDRHACRLARAAELAAHRPNAAEAAADRGCRLGSGSCCWELDEDTPRARRSPEQAVAVAAKSCDEGDFHECDWLGFALGRREPIMKDDARYRAADRGGDRFAMESCRAGDIEICQRGIKIVSSGKKALEAQLETTAAARCDAGEIGACVAFGNAILFTQTERARGILEESCNGGALGSCWSYASALRITGKAAPLGVEIQRLVARACEHTAVGCGELEAIAEGSLE